VWAVLRCVTADIGYVVGDKVPIVAYQFGSGDNAGVGLIVSGENILVNIGADGIGIYSRANPGTMVAITQVRWRIVVRAIA
jgi:hypothetical protein